ncbi:MAG: SDR family oxidoreductase [Steroidobacteraceae bacterium]|nr:SDR family oxidoreductase [Steroidobacteraceae bacterium]MBP7014948.1 SDR family oxidoreductase [Steroidobacteraceae bacterium]
MRRSFNGATVVVSGAGNGLGRALALRFARGGARIVALDRDPGAAAAVTVELAQAGFEALACPCDVTDASACQAAVEATVARFGRIDVLVNNAGISHRSPFAATETAVLRRVVEVNLFGAINLTRPALPALQQSRGLIVAVSSIAGFTPLIARTGYSASKHALHGFFESLRTELAPDGIDVMMVCPSFIATGIDRNALGADGGAATHAQVVVGQRLQPDEVADRVFRGAERSSRLLLIGRTAHAAWWVSRLVPSLYERIMARTLRGEMIP